MVDQFGGWRADYPGQQPWNDPQFIRIYGQQQTSTQPNSQSQQPTATTSMTRPIIHAEIVQVEDEQAAAQYPVGVGASQMMIARDESTIFVKTAMQNGKYTMDVFVKRPPAPEPTPFNPAEYVRLDALPALVAAEVRAAIAATIQPVKPARGKKETEASD